MGITLRATTLIVATAVVTLSSAANAHNRLGVVRGEHRYGIRWCSGPSAALGLPYFYPCGRSRYYYSDAYRRYYSDPNRYYYR